jgi:membrane protein YdbS with pleckstrin-like domain
MRELEINKKGVILYYSAPLIIVLVPAIVFAFFLGLPIAFLKVFTTFSVLCSVFVVFMFMLSIDNSSYILDDDVLRVKKGIFMKVVKEIQLSKITDIEKRDGPLMRLFGIDMLLVQTAGSPGYEAILLGLVDSHDARSVLLLRKNDGIDFSKPVRPLSNNTPNDIKVKIKNLDDLYGDGVINEDEYVAMRKEIISQIAR